MLGGDSVERFTALGLTSTCVRGLQVPAVFVASGDLDSAAHGTILGTDQKWFSHPPRRDGSSPTTLNRYGRTMGPKKDCASAWQALKMDTFRQAGKFSIGIFVKSALTRRTFRPIVTLRFGQAVARSHGLLHLCLPILRILHLATTHLAGIDLPWRTEIGPGFCITHGWGMVVSPMARIGKNVTLFQGVTLGQLDLIGSDGQRTTGYPTLEDEVWVGPHAIIVGNIIVGRGSIIAGGALVTKSVPRHTVIAGNPAEILRRDCVADVSNPAPVSNDDTKV